MSSRALRRLEKQREEARLAEQKNLEETESDEEQVEPVKKAQNLFALIGEEVEEDEESDDDLAAKEVEDVSKETPEELSDPETEPVRLPTKSQKKNKKKKKGKKKTDVKKVEEEDDDDELDRIIKELNRKEKKLIDTTEDDNQEDDADEYETTHDTIDSSYRYFTPYKQYKSAHFLKLDVKDLDPDNEFKRLFGKLSAEALEDADSTTSTSIPPQVLQQIKRMSKVVRGWGGRDRRSIPGTSRKLILTKVRDDWIPTPKKDITMEELSLKEIIDDKAAETEDWLDVVKDDVVKLTRLGIRFYKFESSPESKIPNSLFYQSVVAEANHENLMNMVSRFPYHVQTILQTALILIRQGDKSNSNGLVERALFTFDRGFKQNFDLSNGLTRLPFNYHLNRQFYLAVFRYIEVLTKKGTLFTAFTYVKLLLALSPADDPYGVRYFIDFYAIVADEYEYLTEIIESPLVKTYSKWYTPGLAYSSALAFLFLKKERQAKDALKRAFVQHPYTGYKLLEAIGLASDIPVSDHSVFEVGQETELSTEAYLLRAPIIWKEAQHRKFLHDTLLEFINSKVKFEPTKDGVIPTNFLRFAILSGEGKLMAKIPPEMWEQHEIFEFDVLPPEIGNVELLEDFVDPRIGQNEGMDDEALMEMVRNISLQDQIDAQINDGIPGGFPE